jgi:hypothetical protein
MNRPSPNLWPFLLPALASLACLLPPCAHALQTRSFVVSNFYPAHYYGDDTCPHGLNPTPDVFFKRDLKLLGVPQADVNAMFDKDYNNQNAPPTTKWVSVVATRGNGRDSVYLHPTTVPDAHLNLAIGRFAYGFNLDGKGAASPKSYENPGTHERGVDNQLFRVLGCFQVYKGNPAPQPPLEAEYRWHSSRPMMGAWLISISGEDLTRDGEVTVTFQSSVDPVSTQDANAQIQRDLTYRVADHPVSRNVLHGRIKNGIVTTDPAPITMLCDAYIQPRFEFDDARVRFELKPDGSLEGLLGGYQPWYPIYWSHAKVGYIDERGFGVDVPALYYALRKSADAYPDPQTGENTAISAAYTIQAVPVFITPLNRSKDAAVEAWSMSNLCARIDLCRRLSAALRRVVEPAAPETPGAPVVARRLTPDQYRAVVTDVFGPTMKIEGRFEPGIRDDGLFAVGYGHVGVTSTGLEQYDAMARVIAAQVVSPEHRDTLIPCTPQTRTAPDDACAAQFFANAGPRLYRRPLTPTELEQAVAIARVTAQSLSNFYSGLEMSLAGMLESPPFLFRLEVAEPDPNRPGSYRLDAYSRASQLSFFLWDSGPDDALMEAARTGALQTETGLRNQVDRMLKSPRLESGIRAFFADMLQFDLFDTLAKDAKIYPKWTVQVGLDAQEQTLRTIVDLVLTQRGDYRDLFTTRKTFLTPMLGSIYGVPVAQNVAPWQSYEFPDGDPRAGLLAHASFVALHSHEGLSSPTLRGKALRELLLCEPVPPPPGDVNFAVAQDTHNPNFKTMRDRLSAHRTDPTCAGCHKLMDPMGFALENFDSDAGYRTTENGQPLDTSGELDGIPFVDAAGLGRAMHDNPATGACLVRRVYSYATGRGAARRDMPWIRYLEKGFAEDGYRTAELMRRVALSNNLYRVAAPGMPAAQLTSLQAPFEESAK